MPSFSFNINVYGGDITFLPGVEKWINWFIETRVLRPFVLPERLTVPVKFLYDPTLEVTAVPGAPADVSVYRIEALDFFAAHIYQFCVQCDSSCCIHSPGVYAG